MGVSRDPAARLMAGRPHPVVTYAELLDAGLGREAIRHRVAKGWLHRVHRGVYLAGSGDPPFPAAELAAVFACGRGAVLSHLAAARLLRMLSPTPGMPDVTVPGGRSPRRPGIRVHRVSRLDARDVRSVAGVPVTAPARTPVDMAAVVDRDTLEEALDTARRERMLSRAAVEEALSRAPRRRGARELRGLLAERGHHGFTRSPPERRLLQLLRVAGLPPPRSNAKIGSKEVDAVWPELRVAVEVDSAAFQTSPRELDADRARDEMLHNAGWTLVRVTAGQLAREPERVLARVAAAVGGARALSREAARV